jgi:hypothetical protein
MKHTDSTYGSRYHLQWYRDTDPESLDNAITSAIKSDGASTLVWRYPTSPVAGKEPTGISFLSPTRKSKRLGVRSGPARARFKRGTVSRNA